MIPIARQGERRPLSLILFRYILFPAILFHAAGVSPERREAPSMDLPSGIQRLSASRSEIDLAGLLRGHPELRLEGGGVRLSPGAGVSLDRALMALTFDEEPYLLKDRRGLYRVLHSDYSASREARSGSGSAFFRLRSQNVSLRTADHLWPIKHEEAFTISFWFRPMYFFRSSNLFRRVSYASDPRKGIEIQLEQDRIRLNLAGILRYGEDIADDVSFLSQKRIEKGKWHHLALSLDARKGVAILFLDGREEGRFVLTRKGRLPEIDFSSPDLAPIVLGGNYIGYMDELFLLDGAVSGENELDISPFGALAYNHHSGRGVFPVEEATTPVYSLEPAIEELRLRASGKALEGSSLRLFYRVAAAPFRETDPLPWRQWGDLARGPGFLSLNTEREHAGYLQLKVQWQPDASGMHSPVLESLHVEQNVADSPGRPAGVRVVDELSRDGRVCLEWRINPEIEIEEKGGYLVHVGVRPGEYEALIDRLPGNRAIRKKNLPEFPLTAEEKRLEQRRPEFIKELKRSRIRLFIDNELLVRARLERQPRRPLPYFEVDHPYYFAVSARIHEKAPSRPSTQARALFRQD